MPNMTASLPRIIHDTNKETKKQAQLDEGVRNCIEGKFGEGKRRFSLDRVMAKLDNTAETTIAITFLVMNLSRLLRQLYRFFCLFQNQIFILHFRPCMITKSYA